MTESPRPPDAMEALTVLMLRYLDGDCSAEEVRQLRAALTDNAASRTLFVQVCRTHGELHETYAPRRAARQQRVAAVAVGRAGETTLPAAGGDLPARPEPPEKLSDRDTKLGSSADAAVQDAGADTDIRQLSGEDTHFPKDKTPDQ